MSVRRRHTRQRIASLAVGALAFALLQWVFNDWRLVVVVILFMLSERLYDGRF